MKVTKRQLKQIIKEELEEALSERSDVPDAEEAEELAAVFEKSPVIMDAVEQAMQDPKVQAALEQASSMQEGGDPYADAYRKRAKLSAAGIYAAGGGVGVGGSAAALGVMTVAQLMGFMPHLAQTPAILALGIVAGPALMALAHIAANKFSQKAQENERKSRGYDRKITDFPHWTHDKLQKQSEQS